MTFRPAAVAAGCAMAMTLGCPPRDAGAGEPAVTPVFVGRRPAAPLSHAVELWSRGKKKAALAWFKEAVRVAPRDPVAWHNLGVALFEFGRYREAMVAYRHEWFFGSVSPSAWHGIGMCWLAQGEPKRAENAFLTALGHAPRRWEYWRGLGWALARQGRGEESRLAHARAARLMPRPPLARWNPMLIRKAVATLKFPRAVRDP